MSDADHVTQILNVLRQDQTRASEELLPVVYQELRKLADQRLSREGSRQTLQATALVHEAYLRLVDVEHQQRWDSRGHFFAAAAEAMRRILVERARRNARRKHGGGFQRVAFREPPSMGDATPLDLVELDAALDKLERHQSDKCQVVKLRFFAGLTIQQTAAALDMSVSTAERHWAYARAWLYREITAGREDPA